MKDTQYLSPGLSSADYTYIGEVHRISDATLTIVGLIPQKRHLLP